VPCGFVPLISESLYFAQNNGSMSTRLIVDTEHHLHEIREPDFPPQPAVVRAAASFFSYVFHPVFLPVYVMIFMIYVHPWVFTGFDRMEKINTMRSAVMMFTFFPLITVLLLKGLKFIDSIYLKTQKERVIPFISSMIWYFWLWHVWRNLGKTAVGDMPEEAVRFALAAFISSILGLMANIKMKVSLHAIAAGVMLTFMVLLAFDHGLNFGIYLSIAIFIAGLVCTSRFIVSDHTQAEVYGGLIVGVVAMLLGYWLG
jgi:hypothetical protein